MYNKLLLYFVSIIIIFTLVSAGLVLVGLNSYLALLAGAFVSFITIMFFYKKLTAKIFSMEKQLEAAITKNKKAEGLRQEFVANVTHELRTPLTSISGYAETLQGNAGADDKLRSHFLDIIAIEATRLDRLIEDVLILSEIENSTSVGERFLDEDIDVKACINEVLDVLSPVADKNNVSISFYIPYEIHIGGEIDRFKQLIMNLVANAIKYSWEDMATISKKDSVEQKKVWIRAKRDMETVVISIRDEGIGIAKNDIPRLFERFYRVDRSRSRDAGGTGLGLAIVKHIAVLFSAKVFVESEIGKGTIFTLKFKG
jgi:two-component system phosphate regulon sensor histidine kinase PhoR